jgi:B-cell receptor-associated protein 31
MAKIQQRTIEAGILNPTDQVLMSKHMLEASLMGAFQFPFFLTVFMINSCCFYFHLCLLV